MRDAPRPELLIAAARPALVVKWQVLGKTGETALAAGDHLHFGICLDGGAVLPVEWWDQKWIDENITPKLEGFRKAGSADEPKLVVRPAGSE